jgi:hypothetical protein
MAAHVPGRSDFGEAQLYVLRPMRRAPEIFGVLTRNNCASSASTWRKSGKST